MAIPRQFLNPTVEDDVQPLAPAHDQPLYGNPLLIRERVHVERTSAAAWCVAAYAFVAIGRVSDSFPGLHLATIVAGIAIAMVGTLPALDRPRMREIPQVRTAIGLFLLALITMPLAIWPGGTWEHVSGLYLNAVLLFVLIAYGVRSLADVRAVVWGLFAAALLLEVGQLLSERIAFGATYDPNDIAFVMICLLPIASSYFAAADGGARWIAGLAALLAVGAIVLTRSRGGFVSLCVIGVVLLFCMPARCRSLRFLLIIAGVVIFSFFASAEYWKRIATIWTNDPTAAPEAYDQGGLAAARLTIWSTGLDLFTRHPVLGVGAGGFQVAEGLSHGGAGKWNAAHNSFLQIAVELGTVGFVLFIAQLRRAILDCRALIREARARPELERWLWLAQGLEVSIYAYIISGTGLSQGYSYVLYLLVGLTAVIHRLALVKRAPEAERR